MNLRVTRTIVGLLLGVLISAACGSAGTRLSRNAGKINICHATDSETNPYAEISIDLNELSAHTDHKNDLIPAPVDGCPKVVQMGLNDGKISICHASGSATNPYDEIRIDFNGLRGHSNHADDIIPAPQGGCPMVTGTATISLTPTVTLTPSITTTAAATAPGETGGKITICHATGSSKNRYVMITVSVNGLNGHGNHKGDIIPAPAGGCPK